jgi:hypothetical protein
VTDGIGTPPFKRKPVGLLLTYILIIPALMYAFHRRHWVIRKIQDLRLRRKIKPCKTAPKKIRADLDRLDAPELEILLECLKPGSLALPKIYGHKVVVNGKWVFLPDSTFSRLVRIPEIIESLNTPKEFSDCAEEITARLRVLNNG